MAMADWLDEKLLERGLDVVEYRGWETRARPGGPLFNPRGVVCHHTGPWSTVSGMVQLCINGRSDLPGPLCQVVLDPGGVCHLIAAGRSNHAGAGGWRGLSGNSSVLGIEAIHSGSRATPWPAVQVEAFVRCAAAMADGLGVDAEMVCGHREWTSSKIDPIGLDMDDFRAGVAELLAEWHRPKETRPMWDPPLLVVDFLPYWAGSGGYMLFADGGIGAVGDAPHRGADNQPFGHDYWGDRRPARIQRLGEHGYVVTSTSSERYEYP
jgi:hypothetical protein